jgi:hypothetical protein
VDGSVLLGLNEDRILRMGIDTVAMQMKYNPPRHLSSSHSHIYLQPLNPFLVVDSDGFQAVRATRKDPNGFMQSCSMVVRKPTSTPHESLSRLVFFCVAIPRVFDATTHLQKFITMPERQKIKVRGSRARGLPFLSEPCSLLDPQNHAQRRDVRCYSLRNPHLTAIPLHHQVPTPLEALWKFLSCRFLMTSEGKSGNELKDELINANSNMVPSPSQDFSFGVPGSGRR